MRVFRRNNNIRLAPITPINTLNRAATLMGFIAKSRYKLQTMEISWKKVGPLVCGLFLCIRSLDAAGFAIQENSISGLGNAFAAGAAAAEDNSVIFTNPAALTLLDQSQFQAGIHFLSTDAEFQNNGTTTLGVPTQGSNASSEESAMIPNLYYSQPISKNWSIGLGVTAPFGLTTEWGNDWVGRYIADKSELKDVNINPTVAYRLNEHWSIGVSANIAMVSAELSNALDMGLVLLNAVNSGAIPAAAIPAPLLGDIQASIGSSKYDGFFKVEGDATGYGYNVGVLFEPNDQTRIGLHYRSSVVLDLEGDVEFTVGALDPILGANFPNGGGNVDLELPSILNVSIYHQIQKKWAVMADVQRTGWSTFENLIVEFEQNTPPDSVVPEKWEDVWRYSVGLDYQIQEDLKLRTGIAFDQSPVPSERYRSPRIPDADRIWYSGGLQWNLSDTMTVNTSATWITVDDPMIDNDTHSAGQFLKGSLDASVLIFSANLVIDF